MACSYSFDGVHGASPPSPTAGPVPPCSGASCSGYQAGSPARGNARTATSWVRMWSGWPYPPNSL